MGGNVRFQSVSYLGSVEDAVDQHVFLKLKEIQI